jgi:hypothetical protein
LDEHILNHPLAENEPDIQNKLDMALFLLLETYQIVGSKEISYEKENNAH